MKTVFFLCLFAASSYAVTLEEISAQREIVERAVADLDSLTSEAAAEAIVVDSTLGVTAYVATRSSVTGDRDPAYVDIAIPLADWPVVYQRLWAISLRESGIFTISAGFGRYTIHAKEAQSLVTLAEGFITDMEAEDEQVDE